MRYIQPIYLTPSGQRVAGPTRADPRDAQGDVYYMASRYGYRLIGQRWVRGRWWW